MPPPSERARTAAVRARSPTSSAVPSVGTTLGRLATALAIAAGALLEHPDGSSPLPPLALFAVAVAVAIAGHELGARARHVG